MGDPYRLNAGKGPELRQGADLEAYREGRKHLKSAEEPGHAGKRVKMRYCKVQGRMVEVER